MDAHLTDVINWFAPLASTIISAAFLALISQKAEVWRELREQDRRDTDEKRRVEAEWRESVDRRMEDQDRKIDSILSAQCSQMRSDIIHKCHRYLDDLGKASTEEKQALYQEHREYAAMCEANDIVNNFVDRLVARVMELPEREV